MAREYRTTVAMFSVRDLPVPVPPGGEGWVLSGAASWQGHVYFFWSRDDGKRPPKQCLNPRCTSIAFVDGKCVGCGFPLPEGP